MENEMTVSSGDALEELPEELQEETTEVLEIDYVTTEDLQNMTKELIEVMTEEETVQTIWDKPIEEYTPTEGMLLILVVIALWFVIKQFIGGIFK
uniref:hypothetical protein n=1 Tax=Acetatifactor sp. TaxID=1872090 RepID=UPI0040574820